MSEVGDSHQHQRSPSSRGRGLRLWLMAASLAAVVTGTVLVVLQYTGGRSASFGWFADPPPRPAGWFLTVQDEVGLVLGVTGLVVFAFCAGWALGVRQEASTVASAHG